MRTSLDLRHFQESRRVTDAGQLWEEATQARFLSAISDGTLPEEAFRRWLAQDYLFARGLTSYQAIVLAKSPRSAHQILIAGLSALDDELSWFEGNAQVRRVDLEASPHPICRRYVDFLIASAYSLPFSLLVTILYGVEVSYLASWSLLEKKGPYAEFIERWSNDRFADYVRGLLDLSEQHPHPDSQQYFDEVLRHERDFWHMTLGG